MAESKPIKNSELFNKDLFEAEIKKANELEVSLSGVVSNLKLLNKESVKLLKSVKIVDSKSLKEANLLLAETTKNRKLAKAAEEQLVKVHKEKQKVIDDSAKKNKAISDEEKAIAKSRAVASQQRIKQLQAESVLLDKQAGNEAKILARLTLLRIERSKLTGEEKDYLDQVNRINTSIDKENDLLDTLSDKQKKAKANVGNYKESVKEALAESNLFNDALGKLGESNSIAIEGFSRLTKGLKSVKEGLANTEGGAKKLGFTLKAIGIGLLISALASLGAFFKTSRNGAQQFNLLLARVSATINVLVGNLAVAGDSLLKFGKAFATLASGKGILFLLRGEFEEFGKQFTDIKDSLEGVSTAFDGTTDRINKQIDATVKLTEETFKYENQLRALQLAQQKLNLDEEDFNEISADTTRTLKERNEALEFAGKARKASAKIGVEIAKTEKDLAFNAVLNDLRAQQVSEAEIERLKKRGAEYVITNEIINKSNDENIQNLQEKIKEQVDAEDKLADLPRQEAKLTRERIQADTLFRIEQTRSKKLSADSEVAILTKQVADEKIQLEERRKIREELFQAETDTFLNQQKIFNEGIDKENIVNAKGDAELKARVDFQDLANTRDVVALAEKIRGLKISEEQQTEVAKIVKEAQLNEIANNEIIAKQEEEEIKRKQTIASIEAEILELQKQSEIDTIKEAEQERQSVLDESNSKILNGENVFNKRLLDERKNLYIETQILADQEFELRRQQLLRKARIEKENIEISENDNLIEAEKKKKVDEQLNIDLQKLDSERNKAQKTAEEKEAEELQKIENKKTEIVLDELSKVTSIISSELDKRDDLRNQQAEKEIEKTQNAISRQQELAEKGLDNQLAFEQANLEKRELAQRDALERQARQKEIIALTEAYLNAYNAELKQPDADPNTAAVLALKDVLLAKGIAKGLVQFAADGNNMIEGPGTQTSDSIPFMLSKHEAVVKAEENIKHNDAVVALNAGVFDKLYVPRGAVSMDNAKVSYGISENIYSSIIIQQNREMLSKLDEISAKPVPSFDVDGLKGLFIEKMSYKNKTEKTVHKIRF